MGTIPTSLGANVVCALKSTTTDDHTFGKLDPKKLVYDGSTETLCADAIIAEGVSAKTAFQFCGSHLGTFGSPYETWKAYQVIEKLK